MDSGTSERTMTTYANPHQSATCTGCSKPIVWVYTEPGCKRHPMDAGFTIIEQFQRRIEGPGSVRIRQVQRVACSESHFATCTEVSRFKKRKAVGA